MHRPNLLATRVDGVGLLSSGPALAHGFTGLHRFVSARVIDDPNVADEASLGDRIVPPRLRRSVSNDPRRANRGPVELMRCGVLIGLAMLAQPSPAFSHAFLDHASPRVGSEIATSPPELSITFTQEVEPLFSTIEVDGPNGVAVATGKPRVAPDNNQRLVLELPKLTPGTYTVIWHVTSVDTHKTEGRYTFTVIH